MGRRNEIEMDIWFIYLHNPDGAGLCPHFFPNPSEIDTEFRALHSDISIQDPDLAGWQMEEATPVFDYSV